MARAARRDQEAFTTLVRRHQAALVNFFRRMGDYSSAEDLAQETFIRLFRYRRKYRPTAKFTTFLYVLARRRWSDHCRALKRRKRAYAKVAEEAETQEPTRNDSADEAKARVSAALAGLTEEMRTVVVMSVYQGFKYREIADVTGIPLGTVKTRMFHALRRLKEALNDDEDE